MKIVIEMNKKDYSAIQSGEMCLVPLLDIVKKGKKLPNERLISAEALAEYIDQNWICEYCDYFHEEKEGWGCDYDCPFPDHMDYFMDKMLKDQEVIVPKENEKADRDYWVRYVLKTIKARKEQSNDTN